MLPFSGIYNDKEYVESLSGFMRRMLYDKEKEFIELLWITWSSSFFVIYSSAWNRTIYFTLLIDLFE